MSQTKRQACKKIVGKTFESNNYGPFVVVAKAGRNKWGRQLYAVRFVKTEYETVATKQAIMLGKLRDPYTPSVAGVGYIGAATSREGGAARPSYCTWAVMLNRCYNPNHQRFYDWGERGIRVCERWLSFENYLNDIKLLAGYEDQERDTIDRINNDADYSPSNCRWASMKAQAINRRARKDRREFEALSPDKKSYKGDNQAQFAREHGLSRSHISGCLHGRAKTHKGWRFEFVDADQ